MELSLELIKLLSICNYEQSITWHGQLATEVDAYVLRYGKSIYIFRINGSNKVVTTEQIYV